MWRVDYSHTCRKQLQNILSILSRFKQSAWYFQLLYLKGFIRLLNWHKFYCLYFPLLTIQTSELKSLNVSWDIVLRTAIKWGKGKAMSTKPKVTKLKVILIFVNKKAYFLKQLVKLSRSKNKWSNLIKNFKKHKRASQTRFCKKKGNSQVGLCWKSLNT